MLRCFNRLVGVVIKGTANSAVGLGFKSRAGKILHSVANGSPPLRRLFEAVLFRREAAKIIPGLVTRFGVIRRV